MTEAYPEAAANQVPAPSQDILRRMLAPRVAESDPKGVDVAALMRLALGRAARVCDAVPLVSDPVRMHAVSYTEVLERPEPGMFIAIVENARGRPGLLLFDSDPALAVVDFQTLGHVPAEPEGPRRLTRTGAALVAPLLDQVLAEFDAAIVAHPELVGLAGFRIASVLDDHRPVALILDDVGYTLLDTRIVVGGARAGAWVLAVPARPAPDVAAPPGDISTPPADGASVSDWNARLRGTVSGCRTNLQAVLGRIRLPLCDALELAPGMRLELPLSALESVRVETECGKVIATARLGQSRGMRALRLTSDPDDPPAAAQYAVPRLVPPEHDTSATARANTAQASFSPPAPGSSALQRRR